MSPLRFRTIVGFTKTCAHGLDHAIASRNWTHADRREVVAI